MHATLQLPGTVLPGRVEVGRTTFHAVAPSTQMKQNNPGPGVFNTTKLETSFDFLEFFYVCGGVRRKFGWLLLLK